MKQPLVIAACVAALSLTACGGASALGEPQSSSAANDLQAFPAAEPGQVRHVIRLPTQGDEDALKVELIFGQTTRVDCNRKVFGGEMQTRTAQGWGYDYFVLPSLGQGATTLMGCPPNSERDAFVTTAPQPLVRYNSRLPLVVYAPEGVEVRYRLWRAGETQTVR